MDGHQEFRFEISRTEEGVRHPMEQYPSSWHRYNVALIVCQYHS
jgi:hypothetical protein